MNIDVTNAIIVFDEGHNIAGLLREAASVDVSLTAINAAYHNLCALASGARNRRHMYAALRDVVAGLRRMLQQFIAIGGGADEATKFGGETQKQRTKCCRFGRPCSCLASIVRG